MHRFHHSVHAHEGKNYGAVLMVFDLLLGKFVYTTGRYPREVGVPEAAAYPDSSDLTGVLALPFKKSQL